MVASTVDNVEARAGKNLDDTGRIGCTANEQGANVTVRSSHKDLWMRTFPLVDISPAVARGAEYRPLVLRTNFAGRISYASTPVERLPSRMPGRPARSPAADLRRGGCGLAVL